MPDVGRWQPPPPPPLTQRAAHVWRIQLGEGDGDALRAVLSANERARADTLAFDALRRDYIVAHGMLRRILARYVDMPAEALVFTTGEHGKPALDAATDIQFNLAHSGALALVAVARVEVGVDVERWSSRVSVEQLAPRVFSRAERLELDALASPDERTAGFYAAWTRKEAYMKATGHGITRGFDHFDVTLRADAAARLSADRLDASAAERWRMWTLDVGRGYSAALAAAAPVDELRLIDAQAAGAAPDPS